MSNHPPPQELPSLRPPWKVIDTDGRNWKKTLWFMVSLSSLIHLQRPFSFRHLKKKFFLPVIKRTWSKNGSFFERKIKAFKKTNNSHQKIFDLLEIASLLFIFVGGGNKWQFCDFCFSHLSVDFDRKLSIERVKWGFNVTHGHWFVQAWAHGSRGNITYHLVRNVSY